MQTLNVTLEELLEEMDQANDDPIMVIMCHGAPRCDKSFDEENPPECPWCFRCLSNDRRTEDELMEAMNREH